MGKGAGNAMGRRTQNNGYRREWGGPGAVDRGGGKTGGRAGTPPSAPVPSSLLSVTAVDSCEGRRTTRRSSHWSLRCNMRRYVRVCASGLYAYALCMRGEEISSQPADEVANPGPCHAAMPATVTTASTPLPEGCCAHFKVAAWAEHGSCQRIATYLHGRTKPEEVLSCQRPRKQPV